MHIKPISIGPIHFVGIGGIGMSGIAEILHNLEYTVQGSDLSENANIVRLQKMGIKTYLGQRAEQVDNAAVLVVSSAIKPDNPELLAARKRGIPVVKRAEMLAEIMRLRLSIAVAGTHGKTTTTSLVASVLDNANLDPTVINGGIINAYGTNARLGKGNWIVAEADESDGSFTKLPLTVGIITNIEAEHLDFYKDLDEVKEAFHKFVQNIPFYGLGIVCIDHPTVREMLPSFSDRRILTYGFSEDADVRIDNLRGGDLAQSFDVVITPSAAAKLNLENQDGFTLEEIKLPMVGKHNVSNATASLAAGLELSIDPRILIESFKDFAGVKRRFTKVGEVNGITIIDDYAHHPTEIEVVLESAKLSVTGEIIAVVQPHRYTRLSSLMDEFAQSLTHADRIIVAPVYAAGEEENPTANHLVLADKIKSLTDKPVETISGEQDLAPLIKEVATPGSFVICMGAGDITQWAYRLPESLSTLPPLNQETPSRRTK